MCAVHASICRMKQRVPPSSKRIPTLLHRGLQSFSLSPIRVLSSSKRAAASAFVIKSADILRLSRYLGSKTPFFTWEVTNLISTSTCFDFADVPSPPNWYCILPSDYPHNKIIGSLQLKPASRSNTRIPIIFTTTTEATVNSASMVRSDIPTCFIANHDTGIS